MAEGTFVTAINCMDGRTQEPVAAWLKQTYGADYVDTITEPGPDLILAGGDSGLIDSIHTRLRISVEKHGSRVVAVVAHDHCAGNPVDKTEHLRMLDQSMQRVLEWGFPVTVVGLWVDGDNWQVEKIAERAAP